MAKKTVKKTGRTVPRVKPKRKKKCPRHPSGLTPKELRFVDLYFENLGNASAAAAGAGYAFPGVTGSQLLIRPRVKAEIERRRDIIRKRSDDQFFQERNYLRTRAGTVITDVVEVKRGVLMLRDLLKLTRYQRAAIKSISQTVSKQGVTTKVTMHDARADFELVWKTEGRLQPENGDANAQEEFRKTLEMLHNGDKDALTGIPANGDGDVARTPAHAD